MCRCPTEWPGSASRQPISGRGPPIMPLFQRGHATAGAIAAPIVAARRVGGGGERPWPRPQTANNPARLTRREAEVLVLMREGASNADIAARLFLSEKTVHHHVSAILRKLGAASRTQAVALADGLSLRPNWGSWLGQSG
jgi:DNA-binding CsgD family transcriptional regulator